jgi:hypothetical protein
VEGKSHGLLSQHFLGATEKGTWKTSIRITGLQAENEHREYEAGKPTINLNVLMFRMDTHLQNR